MQPIAARRKQPRQDVISHLVGLGYNRLDILVECLTYATAGMVTTREFICIAAWHLLHDAELRRRYLNAEQEERRQLLREILRLEPVASTLWRRAERDLSVADGETVHQIPAGALMILDLRRANADAAAVGAEPLRLVPGRSLGAGVRPEAMSFGDGEHRCPGAFLAIHESDLFLQQLLSLGVDLHSIERRKGLGEFVLRLDFEQNVKPYLMFLADQGISADDFGKMITKNPLLFKEDLDDLQTRMEYLKSKRFSDEARQRILTHNPYWLMFSTRRIDRRLGYFQKEFH